MTLTHRATRVDGDVGIREIAEFFGPDRLRMFGFTHLPLSSATGGVVVCSPLYAEFIRNYRREVLLGRLLASQGVAVQRFHYRGEGNSDGDPGDLNFENMLDDALAAAERLVESAGVARLAFFGTRWGGLVAAAAARRFDVAPLALWDPVVDPSQYLADIFRARRLQALKEGSRDLQSAAGLMEQLNRDGAIHILGYSVSHSLYESGRGRSLEREVGSSPRPLLIVQLGRDPRLHRGLTDLVTRWQESGFDVESPSIGRQEAWWFTAGALVNREALTQPVDVTVNWLIRTLSERRAHE